MPSLREEMEVHYASELVNVVFVEAQVAVDGKLQPTLDEWYALEQKRMQAKAIWQRCVRKWATKHHHPRA